ncbi:MAG: transposase [Chitinophagaceae bacterium]
MSSKYKFSDQEKLYFVSYAVVYWIDLFTRNEYKDILLKSWRYCMDTKGMELYGWCIMTSHVHMIIGTHGEPLENIMRDMKRHTSEQLKIAIKNNTIESRKEWLLWMMEKAGRKNSNNIEFQLWQQDNHPIILNSATITHQKLDYIHNNPVDAGFVEKPEDWLYSSARDYYGLKGLIKISLIDPILRS